MDNLHEEWRPVPSTQGRIWVSNLGRIRSHAPKWRKYGGRVVKGSRDRQGYVRVSRPFPPPDKRPSLAAHLLVAEAFFGPKPPGLVVNHKNGITSDNRVSNLEYVTPSENSRHAFSIGLRTPTPGALSATARLTRDQVVELRQRYAHGEDLTDLAVAYGTTRATVERAANRVTYRNVPMPDGYYAPERELTIFSRPGAHPVYEYRVHAAFPGWARSACGLAPLDDRAVEHSGGASALTCAKCRRRLADRMPDESGTRESAVWTGSKHDKDAA